MFLLYRLILFRNKILKDYKFLLQDDPQASKRGKTAHQVVLRLLNLLHGCAPQLRKLRNLKLILYI